MNRTVEVPILIEDKKFLPEYQHEEDACVDLKSEHDISIEPYSIFIADCGIAISVPEGYKAEILPRSGLATKGLFIVNQPGQVDSGYVNKIKVILYNLSKETILIKEGSRFAQMCLTPVYKFKFIITDDLGITNRGKNGLGSTGV